MTFAEDIRVPRSLHEHSEFTSVADDKEVVQLRDGNVGTNFKGNSDPTADPGTDAPSAVEVGCGHQVIGIIGPTPAPAAPAHDPPSGTLPPYGGGFLDPVPRGAVPRDAGPADGTTGAETEPIASVGGGEVVPAGPGGPGDSQGPGQSPAPAGGGRGSGPDLRPHLVPEVVGGTGSGGARGPEYFCWSVVFCVSLGLLISLCISMLCKWFYVPGDEDRGGSGV